MPNRSARPKAAIVEHNRAIIAEGLLEGMEHADIGLLVGRSRQLVTKEAKRLKDGWKARAALAVNALIEETLARIEWRQAQMIEVWLEARQVVRGSREARARAVLALAGVKYDKLPVDKQAAIALAIGDPADPPVEAMRECGRGDNQRMDLMGLRGEYQSESHGEDAIKPEDIKSAEDADRAWKRIATRYKPFSVVRGGRGR